MRVKRDQNGRIRKHVVLTAPTKVFAIPELLEMILDHVPPLKLHGLRRVNSTFRDTISLRKYRPIMLLDPPKHISVQNVNQILQSPEIDRALSPFAIKASPLCYPTEIEAAVHTDKSGKTLYISVIVHEDIPLRSKEWRHIKNGHDEEFWVQDGRLPGRQENASWRDIIVKEECHEPFTTMTLLEGRRQQSLGDVTRSCVGAYVTIGMLVDACIVRYARYRSWGY